MVAIDAGFLSLLLHPSAKPPNDPATGLPLTSAQLRVERLIEELTTARERIILPCPALAEFLVLAGDKGPDYQNEIHNFSSFYVQPFDERAAVELASIELLARASGSKRGSVSPDTAWQKVKFDRQIVAIAKIRNAHTIYSDDSDIVNIAGDVGLKVIHSWQLPLPTSNTPLLDNSPDPIELT